MSYSGDRQSGISAFTIIIVILTLAVLAFLGYQYLQLVRMREKLVGPPGPPSKWEVVQFAEFSVEVPAAPVIEERNPRLCSFVPSSGESYYVSSGPWRDMAWPEALRAEENATADDMLAAISLGIRDCPYMLGGTV